MATIFPKSNEAFIQFCEDHAPVWKTSASALGLTTAQATAWEANVNKLRGALSDQLKAQQAAKSATVALNDLIRLTRTEGNDLLRIIRGFAGQQEDPNAVYATAEIPPPSPAAPVPPPAQPSDIKVGIDIDSVALILSWKASNPVGSQGTSYIIKRKVAGQSAFEFVGVTGGADKTFTDDTLPAGSDSVTYSIQGQRGNVSGPTRVVTVNFGVVGGQSVVKSVKMAA